jgi:glucosamine-phosphate N-acetyltransferase
MSVSIRTITVDDYDSVYPLLQQLTDVGEYNPTMYVQYINELPPNIHIIGLCTPTQIIGMGTIFIEQKIIHSFSKVGHIEDIVIDVSYNGKGYGKQLIQYLINYAQQQGCYKVILDCSDEVKEFYKKCGFTQKNISMGIYFTP